VTRFLVVSFLASITRLKKMGFFPPLTRLKGHGFLCGHDSLAHARFLYAHDSLKIKCGGIAPPHTNHILLRFNTTLLLSRRRLLCNRLKSLRRGRFSDFLHFLCRDRLKRRILVIHPSTFSRVDGSM